MAVQKLLAIETEGVDAGKSKQVTPVIQSAGTSDAGKPVGTGTDGRLDPSVMPTGIGATVVSAVASEALSAGNFVNIYDDQGVKKVRKADAGSRAKIATGFVKTAYAVDATAEVYLAGEVSVEAVLEELYLTTTPGAGGAFDVNGAVRQLVGRRVGDGAYVFIAGEITIL